MAMTINQAGDTVAATQFADDKSPADDEPVVRDTQAARRKLQAELDALDVQGLEFLDEMQRAMWAKANDLNMCETADAFLRQHRLQPRPQPTIHHVDFTVTLHGRYAVQAYDNEDARNKALDQNVYGLLDGARNNYTALVIEPTMTIDAIAKHNETTRPAGHNHDAIVRDLIAKEAD